MNDPWADTARSDEFEFTEISSDTTVASKWSARSVGKKVLIEQVLEMRNGNSGSSTKKRQMFSVEESLLFAGAIEFRSFNDARIHSPRFVGSDWHSLLLTSRAKCTSGILSQSLESLVWTDGFEPDYFVINELVLTFELEGSKLTLEIIEGPETYLRLKKFKLQMSHFPKLFKILGVSSLLELARSIKVPNEDTWEKVRLFFVMNGDEEREDENDWECANASLFDEQQSKTLVSGSLQEVVGESFNASNFETFRIQFGCDYGQERECLVDLIAEPNNPFSKTGCAVAVKRDGLLLGYIPESVNAAYYELAQSQNGAVHAHAKIWFAPPEPDSTPKNSVVIYSKYPPALPSQ